MARSKLAVVDSVPETWDVAHRVRFSLQEIQGESPYVKWVVAVSLDYAAYVDMSGTDPNQPAFAVGGFVSTREKWRRFTEQWGQLLAEEQLLYFHCTDFIAGADQFPTRKGWDSARKQRFMERATDIIATYAEYAFGISVSKAIAEPAARLAGVKLRKYTGGSVCHLWGHEPPCVLHALQLVLRWLPADLPDTEAVRFIFDRDDIARMTDYRITFEIGRLLLQYRRRFGGVSFFDKRDILPLQAADIIPHQLYQNEKAGNATERDTIQMKNFLGWILDRVPNALHALNEQELADALKAFHQ
jgi:hypothetical protein